MCAWVVFSQTRRRCDVKTSLLAKPHVFGEAAASFIFFVQNHSSAKTKNKSVKKKRTSHENLKKKEEMEGKSIKTEYINLHFVFILSFSQIK